MGLSEADNIIENLPYCSIVQKLYYFSINPQRLDGRSHRVPLKLWEAEIQLRSLVLRVQDFSERRLKQVKEMKDFRESVGTRDDCHFPPSWA